METFAGPSITLVQPSTPLRLRSILKPSSLSDASVHASEICVSECVVALSDVGGRGAPTGVVVLTTLL